MGRSKLDNEFSEKLSQREIKPSEAAWDRLDAMLTVAEDQKPKRNFNWLYIAASFLGIALLATFFLTANPESEHQNQVVHENSNGISADTLNKKLATPKPQIAEMPKSGNVVKANQSQAMRSEQKQPQIAHTVTDQNPISSQSSIVSQNQINPDQPKADELLAQVQTQSETDLKQPVKVNAKSLLNQVDGEQSMTFRQRVLHKVGKNYQSVKVALSNRNIEDENH